MNLKNSIAHGISDFERRKRYAPESITSAGNYGEYIQIHPFADEMIEEGEEQEIVEMCHQVDAWWKNHGMMVFLQVVSFRVWRGWNPGYYAGWDRSHEAAMLKLTAVVDEPLIYRSTFDAALREFSRFGVFYPRVYKRLWKEERFVALPIEYP